MQEQRSPWAVGWIGFAGVLMILVGIFQAFAGLAAIVDDDFYVLTSEYVFEFDTTAWGWIHLILGIVVLLAGFGVFSGNVAARTVGVILAALAGIAAFAWIPYYPVWGIVIVAMTVAVIWALTVHGRDAAV